MPGHADSSATGLALVAAAPLDTLFPQRLEGEEMLGGLFRLQLACRCPDPAVDLAAALGKHVSLTLQAGSVARAFDGLCAGIRQRPAEEGYAVYVLELRPWLWWLTLSSDHRIFQGKSVPEIVEAVFAQAGYADYLLRLEGSYAPREYCVQYGETDFAFVARLLEEEGIHYFFTHAAGLHTMVLADGPDAYPVCPGGATIDFMPPEVGAREFGAIRSGELGLQAASTAFRTGDYAFATPATALAASAQGAQPARTVSEYPGGYATKSAGEALAKKRMDALGARSRCLSGTSDSRALVPGHTFLLAGHERQDANVEWVVEEVRHQGSHLGYENSFTALPRDAAYRPQRATARPRIHGSQTAVVVGKSGEEIWTDEHGRIKVQFHWDRAGKNDENSSCWIRVAQAWAGKGWGAQFIPRIGQEVVVSFLDGDPDRPLVTGCVYNGANPLPYALPAEAATSSLKSRSTKGGEGYNEIRLNDKKDAEELHLHAQKDMKSVVLNDAVREVGHDDRRTIRNDQTLEVQEGNRSVTVTKGNLVTNVSAGNETASVKGTRTLSVEGAETHDSQAAFEHTVGGNYTLTIKGNLTIDVGGSVTLKAGTTIAIEAGTALGMRAGTELSAEAGTSLLNKAGTSLTNEAGLSLTSKAGASQTVDGGGMLALKGGLVKIN